MKKLLFALALMIMGGASLPIASTANAAPFVAGAVEATQTDSGLQLVGGRHHHGKRHWGYRHHYYRHHYYKPYYYKPYYNYCHYHPYHWKCKKHYYNKYY